MPCVTVARYFARERQLVVRAVRKANRECQRSGRGDFGHCRHQNGGVETATQERTERHVTHELAAHRFLQGVAQPFRNFGHRHIEQ